MLPDINSDGLCKIKVPLNLIEKINKSIYQKYNVTCFSGLSEKINKMNDKEFSITSKKINTLILIVFAYFSVKNLLSFNDSEMEIVQQIDNYKTFLLSLIHI